MSGSAPAAYTACSGSMSPSQQGTTASAPPTRASRKRITSGSRPGMSQAATKTCGYRLARRAAWIPARGPLPGKRSATVSTPRPWKRSGRFVEISTCGKSSRKTRTARTAIGSPSTAANALSRPPIREARPPARTTPATGVRGAIMVAIPIPPARSLSTNLTARARGATFNGFRDAADRRRSRRGGRVCQPRALRRRAHRRGPVRRERHPAVSRAGWPLDQARRASDGRVPALPARSARGVGGAAEPVGTHAGAVAGPRRGAPEPRPSGPRRARGARRPEGDDHPERRQPPRAGRQPPPARDPRQRDARALHRVRRPLPSRRDRLRRAPTALPALRRHPQERHGVVRRAHSARRAGGLLRGGGARRLHDRRGHVRYRLPGGPVSRLDPPARRRPRGGEPLRVRDHAALPSCLARYGGRGPAAALRARPPTSVASGRGKVEHPRGAPAGGEADAAPVAVGPRRPAAARRLPEGPVADQALAPGEAIEHRREALEDLGLRLGPLRLLLLTLAAALAGRQRDVGRRAEDDLGLALVLDHLAPYPYLLAAVELLQLLGRKVLEALRLDDGGEAAERRVEGQEARELRAAHAEDPALDHHLLAHVLLGLVPRNDGFGRGDGDRPDDRQCASQPEQPRTPLDPAEAHSVNTAVTPTRPLSPTRSSRDAPARRPGPRPDARDATLLGSRPSARARAAALLHLRALLLLSA